MFIHSLPKSVTLTAIIFVTLNSLPLLFAQGLSKEAAVGVSEGIAKPYPALQNEKNLSPLQSQARDYRLKGLEFQSTGNIDAALSLYQKAIELDPNYAVAFNDLGIVFEERGLIERAEESYLKAIKIDPCYLSAYSNLALLYEGKRDLEKAAFYWKKRIELGLSDDPWVQKAQQRLKDIKVVQEGGHIASLEQEVIGLTKDMTTEKSILKQDNNALAKKHFEKAKRSYNKQDYATAIKEALDAQYLDPANTEIEKFIEKVQIRALSR